MNNPQPWQQPPDHPSGLPAQSGPSYPSSPGLPLPAPTHGSAPGYPPPGRGTPTDATGPIQQVAPSGQPPIEVGIPAEYAAAEPASASTAGAPPDTRAAGSPGRGSQSAGLPLRKHSRTGAAWVALIVAAIVFVFLLIFVMQNSDPVQVKYLVFEGTMPLGVAMTFAALAGALTVGLLGTVRILQLRARARRAAKPSA